MLHNFILTLLQLAGALSPGGVTEVFETENNKRKSEASHQTPDSCNTAWRMLLSSHWLMTCSIRHCVTLGYIHLFKGDISITGHDFILSCSPSSLIWLSVKISCPSINLYRADKVRPFMCTSDSDLRYCSCINLCMFSVFPNTVQVSCLHKLALCTPIVLRSLNPLLGSRPQSL